jgi:hypothetical protein
MRILFSLLLVVTVASFVQGEQVGDMDADDQVGIKEAIIALQVAAGLTPGVALGQYTPASGNASPDDVLAPKTFSNASGSDTGTMPDQTSWTPSQPGTEQINIPKGYHPGTGVVSGDPDLLSGNIRYGTTIFSVAGDVKNCTDTQIDGYRLEVVVICEAFYTGMICRRVRMARGN